jgi:hypothetical protein
VAIETGVQNYTLVVVVIVTSFSSGCERTSLLRIPLIATFWYIINSMLICSYFTWQGRDLAGKPAATTELELGEVELAPVVVGSKAV